MNATRIGKRNTKQLIERAGYRTKVQSIPTQQRRSTDTQDSPQEGWVYIDASGNQHFFNKDEVTIQTVQDFVSCDKALQVFTDTNRTRDPISTRGEITIGWLLERYRDHELETSAREYQREQVAELDFKQGILKTILERPWARVPELHIRVMVDANGNVYYELIDGQQRARASIIGFLIGEFKLQDKLVIDGQDIGKLNHLMLKNTAPQLYQRILNYKISCTWYENINDDKTSELFVEVLNKTNKMANQEIRNAVRGFLSAYIRNSARDHFNGKDNTEIHELFTRIKTGGSKKKKPKVSMNYFSESFALKGRMEVDEFLSQLLYGLEKGYASGITATNLTKWIKSLQCEGGKYKSETDWNKDKKRFDVFLDFCLLMAKEVSDNNKPRFTKNVAYLMFLYGWQLKAKFGSLDKKVFVEKFFDIHTKWSDPAKKLYHGHFKFSDGKKKNQVKSELGQFKDLFGGLNKIAIKSQAYVLDLELNRDMDSFGIIELDPKETFSGSDIQTMYYQQNMRCFYTGRKLPISEIAGDHYIPRSWGIKRGGVTEIHNLRVTSKTLNIEKDNKSPQEFCEYLKGKNLPISADFEALLKSDTVESN